MRVKRGEVKMGSQLFSFFFDVWDAAYCMCV